ncbi:AmiS/UreI family transporter [Glutamicibacter sp. NPDC087344]|uniref:AmiS/UreI family transporter n=1 Tax=Glutamicibacter sp. NPDC087344 TaxID=3363994 RepID=UPI0038253B5F
MAHVGLVFVGLILFINGLVSLGRIPERSAALLNLMVGGVQILLPTLIMVQAGENTALINNTWPSYLFGMTYLLVGLNTLFGFQSTGFGWFSLFVAAIAVYEAVMSLNYDPVFSVIWLAWAIMWLCLFAQHALGRSRVGRMDLQRFGGWLLVSAGIPSSTVPALFAQNGLWSTSAGTAAVALAALGAALGFSAWQALRAPEAAKSITSPAA